MIRILLILTSLVVMGGCTNQSAAVETLQKSGYSDITPGGYDFFKCGKDDDFATQFHAKNPSGQYVDGVVCCGLFKGCTVRF